LKIRKAGRQEKRGAKHSCIPYSNFFLNEEGEIKPQWESSSGRPR
jgi:hypothetical protein